MTEDDHLTTLDTLTTDMPTPSAELQARADEFRALAFLGATQKEMAAYFGCSQSTISRYMNETPDCPVAVAIREGRASGWAELRRLQWEKARKGDTTMLIWLGKNMLGQTDRWQQKADESNKVEVTLRLGDKEIKRVDGKVVRKELPAAEDDEGD